MELVDFIGRVSFVLLFQIGAVYLLTPSWFYEPVFWVLVVLMDFTICSLFTTRA